MVWYIVLWPQSNQCIYFTTGWFQDPTTVIHDTSFFPHREIPILPYLRRPEVGGHYREMPPQPPRPKPVCQSPRISLSALPCVNTSIPHPSSMSSDLPSVHRDPLGPPQWEKVGRGHPERSQGRWSTGRSVYVVRGWMVQDAGVLRMEEQEIKCFD